MNQEVFPKRIEQVEGEALIVMSADNGYRIYAPTNPTQSFSVEGLPERPTCTCDDFIKGSAECIHIRAARNFLDRKSRMNRVEPSQLSQQNHERTPEKTAAPTTTNGHQPPQMLLKRSVSPDGRIDSLSVEFSVPIEKLTLGDIKALAERSLSLQSEIAGGFLEKKNGNGKEKSQPQPSAPRAQGNGAVTARILGVNAGDTRWGRSLYLVFDVAGETVKLFGSRRKLGDAIAAAGFPGRERLLSEGLELDLPCRVVLRQHENSKYPNVEKVLPAENRESRKP